jgi:tRNA A-37 threonylcarbamoyl transferase component Bud32
MPRICPTCQFTTEALQCPADGTDTTPLDSPAGGGLVGKTLGGRYRVTRLIGEGGFGAVYQAEHSGTGDVVAIKVLHPEQADSGETTSRFQHEAAVTARLKQPHTVRVFDFGQMDSGALYLAMEFLDGRTLTKVIDTESPLGYERIGSIALQVLKSLAEAHAQGLVHRDLKPDNIFLQNVHGEDDFAKVLDFGIAKSLARGSESRTAAGVIVGTPQFMSPEQARGTPVDARTDLYALGCILFHALTGKLAFASESAIDTLVQRLTQPPPDVRGQCLTPTPDAICEVVRKAMATEANDRYASAQEMAKALTEAMKKSNAPGPQTSRVAPGPLRPARPQPASPRPAPQPAAQRPATRPVAAAPQVPEERTVAIDLLAAPAPAPARLAVAKPKSAAASDANAPVALSKVGSSKWMWIGIGAVLVAAAAAGGYAALRPAPVSPDPLPVASSVPVAQPVADPAPAPPAEPVAAPAPAAPTPALVQPAAVPAAPSQPAAAPAKAKPVRKAAKPKSAAAPEILVE